MKRKATNDAIKVLALSSSGGHWVQMMRLRSAIEQFDVTYATVNAGYQDQVDGFPFFVIPDCTRWSKLGVLKAAWAILMLLIKIRPQVVMTTGAAPGFLAVFLASKLGARTIWIDSIANAEELSLSGLKAGKYVDHWLTQWEHLATPDGPQFTGSVLGELKSEQQTERVEDAPPSTPKNAVTLFVTVGSDIPFDRLIEAVDRWAETHKHEKSFMQTAGGACIPKHVSYADFLEPSDFMKRFKAADVIVAHAGMGSILSALQYGKPILVMPRKGSLGETRNEHQLATVKWLADSENVWVAMDEAELLDKLDRLDELTAGAVIGSSASDRLLDGLREFIGASDSSS